MSHEPDQKLLSSTQVIPRIDTDLNTEDINFALSPALATACYSGIVKNETFDFIKNALTQKLTNVTGETAKPDAVSPAMFAPHSPESSPDVNHRSKGAEDSGIVYFKLNAALSKAVEGGKITAQTVAPIAKALEAGIMRDITLNSIKKTKYDYVLAPHFSKAMDTEALSNDSFLEQILESAEQAQKFDML